MEVTLYDLLTSKGHPVSDPPTEYELRGVAQKLGVPVFPTTSYEGLELAIRTYFGEVKSD